MTTNWAVTERHFENIPSILTMEKHEFEEIFNVKNGCLLEFWHLTGCCLAGFVLSITAPL